MAEEENLDDLGDLAMIPDLSGLSRLQTDPMQQQQETQQPLTNDNINESTDLTDLEVLPNLSGLSRLQTDPMQQQQQENDQELNTQITDDMKIDDLESFGVPNLSGLSRLQTDPIMAQQQTQPTSNNNNDDESLNDVELIPVYKFAKTPSVIKLLENGIDTDFINWNIWDLYEIADHYTMSICTNYLFNKLNLFSKLNISSTKFLSFICCIEKGYLKDIDYHSSIHATDVMINSYHYLIKSNIIKKDLDIFIILLSALCHDYKHPGLQSDFLIKTNHEIAIKYGDKSILEQMHYEETINIMEKKRYNFLENFNDKDVKYIKKCMKDMIIGTDPMFHKEYMNKLEKMDMNNDDDTKQNENKLDIMVIGLHAADIGSICKSWNIFVIWSRKIFSEWFKQGDKEKELGMEVTKYFDRDSDIDKIGEKHDEFIVKMMLPFYQKWSAVFNDKQECNKWCKQLMDNHTKIQTDGLKYQ